MLCDSVAGEAGKNIVVRVYVDGLRVEIVGEGYPLTTKASWSLMKPWPQPQNKLQ